MGNAQWASCVGILVSIPVAGAAPNVCVHSYRAVSNKQIQARRRNQMKGDNSVIQLLNKALAIELTIDKTGLQNYLQNAMGGPGE